MHAKRYAQERGANLVEAALVISLVLLPILVGVPDLGRVYFTYITIINAAREGARWGVTHPLDAGGICAKVLGEAQTQPLHLSSPLSCANIQIENSGGASGSPIRVTVQVDFPLILGGILGRPTLPIRYSVAFPIF